VSRCACLAYHTMKHISRDDDDLVAQVFVTIRKPPNFAHANSRPLMGETHAMHTQVHKAGLRNKNGETQVVAVKVQHAWMSQNTTSDLTTMTWVAKALELSFPGLSVSFHASYQRFVAFSDCFQIVSVTGSNLHATVFCCVTI
jgi:hypothetical protein